MESKYRSYIFAFVMCLVAGLFLTTASESLKPLQNLNKLVDQQKNVLKSLGVVKDGQKYTNTDIQELYKKNVIVKYLDENNQLTDTDTGKIIYFAKSENSDLEFTQIRDNYNILSDKYAIPFSAYGLWSWIDGYISFYADGNTVSGFTVYSHAETPGLGGECEKPWFQNQFKGKKIISKLGKFKSILIAKGKATDVASGDELNHYVDGMSGATITSKGIESYLKESIEEYETFAKVLR